METARSNGMEWEQQRSNGMKWEQQGQMEWNGGYTDMYCTTTKQMSSFRQCFTFNTQILFLEKGDNL